ncbi:hypothetical protein COOONC_09925, partial [Cooperia oncophora]
LRFPSPRRFQVTPHVGHKYAVVKLYPGIDETIFGKLLNGLGLEVFYTNDLNCNQTEEEEVPWSCTENQDAVIAPSVPPIAQTWNDELAIREWMTLIEFIEKNVSVDLNLNNPGPSLNDASVQTSEPETVTPSAEDDAPKTITCMLCQEEVPRDKYGHYTA